MEARKLYKTVYWGKMPVNFRPQVFGKEEVEEAVRHAERYFPDVLDLVPDFSLLAVSRDPERNEMAVLRFGDESKPMVFRRVAAREEGNLPGLLWEVARRIRSRRR